MSIDWEKVAAALELYDDKAFVVREVSPELDALWHAARWALDAQKKGRLVGIEGDFDVETEATIFNQEEFYATHLLVPRVFA